MNEQTPNNPVPAPSGSGGSSSYQTIPEFLKELNVALVNSTHADIAPALAEYGYSPAVINEGKSLLASAVNKYQEQLKGYGEQFEATDEMNARLTIAKDRYNKHLGVARIAFKGERGVLAQLNANGRRKFSVAGWLGQAKTFYNNLLDNTELKNGMKKFNQTETKLKEALDMIDSLEAAIAKQQKEMGEAQTATRLRDDALEKLQDWSSDYKSIARIALDNKPHLLEILGIRP